ncbi:hypothetical protein [Robbsia sp. KACC 23696]|uniref:hypothetical protein n=1 Tax=Robbsia sp. KACC 23696 TaxID=3149231 RepID=UPI00325A882C
MEERISALETQIKCLQKQAEVRRAVVCEIRRALLQTQRQEIFDRARPIMIQAMRGQSHEVRVAIAEEWAALVQDPISG